MAATDVLPPSPAASQSWNIFEDFLDFPSPCATPRLAPVGSAVASSLSQQALPSSTASLDAQAGLSTSTPPPPGSSPEALFRYYLAAELRKIGSDADDTIIDRYVAQHYHSFSRAMDRQNQKSDTEMDRAFRSPPPPTEQTSAPFLLQNSLSSNATGAIDPSFVELSHISNSLSQSSPAHTEESMQSYRTKTEDDMSEDEEQEEDDQLGDLPKGNTEALRRTARTSPAIEDTPIAGSIMGPANELRPDPETYRNLSSKEKRQLRNKISARNFRTRRKEHISHLEQQVADRDTVIEGLRQQLAQVNVHNKELQDEVTSLKTKIVSNPDMARLLDALQKTANTTGQTADTASNPNSLLVRSTSNSSLADAASPRPMSPRANSSLARPNTRKDVPATQSGATRAFWGGVGGHGWPVQSSQAVA